MCLQQSICRIFKTKCKTFKQLFKTCTNKMNTLSDWKKHDLQFRDKNFTKTKFYKIMNFTFQQLLRKERWDMISKAAQKQCNKQAETKMYFKLYILFILINMKRILWLPGMGSLLATKNRNIFFIYWVFPTNKHFNKCGAYIITEQSFISINSFNFHLWRTTTICKPKQINKKWL